MTEPIRKLAVVTLLMIGGVTVTMAEGESDKLKLAQYKIFFTRYSLDLRDNLLQEMSGQDDAILSSVASGEKTSSREQGSRLRQAKIDFCSRRAGRDAVDLAREYQQLIDDHNARSLEQYRTRLATLSPAGRSKVDSVIANEIAPRTQGRDLDYSYEAVAKADPEGFLARLDLICEAATTGKTPVIVEDLVEQLRKEGGAEK